VTEQRNIKFMRWTSTPARCGLKPTSIKPVHIFGVYFKTLRIYFKVKGQPRVRVIISVIFFNFYNVD